jgi:hypothetical protein
MREERKLRIYIGYRKRARSRRRNKETGEAERNLESSSLIAKLITRSTLVHHRLQHLKMKDSVNRRLKLGGNLVLVKDKTDHERKWR